MTGSPSTRTGSLPAPGAPAAADSSVSSEATTSTCALTAGRSCHGRVTRSCSTALRSCPIGRSSPAFFSARACASTSARISAASGSGIVARSSPMPFPTPRTVTSASRSAFFRRRSAAAGSALISSPRTSARSRVIDSPVACGSTTASTAASTSSGDSRAGQPSSAAIARALGQSSHPSASAAQVAGSRRRSVVDRSHSCVAAAREQLRTRASSSGKNSDTSASSSWAAHSPDAAPACPRCRSPLAGRSVASPTTSSALNAASTASASSTRWRCAAFCSGVIRWTGSRSPSRDGRDTTPAGSAPSSQSAGRSSATVTPTPNASGGNMPAR